MKMDGASKNVDGALLRRSQRLQSWRGRIFNAYDRDAIEAADEEWYQSLQPEEHAALIEDLWKLGGHHWSSDPNLMNDHFRDFLREFCAASVRFLLVGAHALAVHAEPRPTRDMDVWVAYDPDNAKRTHTALTRFGAPLEKLSARDLARGGWLFRMGVIPSRIDVMTLLDGVSFGTAWSDQEAISLGGSTVPVIGLSAFLANKRSVRRERDLSDVESVLRHHPDA